MAKLARIPPPRCVIPCEFFPANIIPFAVSPSPASLVANLLCNFICHTILMANCQVPWLKAVFSSHGKIRIEFLFDKHWVRSSTYKYLKIFFSLFPPRSPPPLFFDRYSLCSPTTCSETVDQIGLAWTQRWVCLCLLSAWVDAWACTAHPAPVLLIEILHRQL